MPTSCSVIGCKSRANAGPKKQFFRFPQKRPKVLQQWLMVLDRLDWTPKPSSKICSDHFAPEDFLYRPNVTIPRLKPEAVPSIFPDPDTTQEEVLFDKIKETEDNVIKRSKSPAKVESCDIQNRENLDENTMKQDIKHAGNDDVYSKRPRRTSKINVKMKDFILLDDFRKLNKPEVPKNRLPEKSDGLSAKLKSPEISEAPNDSKHNEKSVTAPKPITTSPASREVDVSKVDAAKELLSILEDSDNESSEPLKDKNEFLINGDSNNDQISSSLSSSPENRSPVVVQLKNNSQKPFKKFQSAKSKKTSHSRMNIAEIASRVKAASCQIKFASRPDLLNSKALKHKTKSFDSVTLLDGKVSQQIIKAKGSYMDGDGSFLTNNENPNLNADEVKFPMRMRTKRPSTDLAKTYFPIRCGENFFYFSYADLNPTVDLSKNNTMMKISSKNIEVSVSANKSKPHLKRRLKKRDEEVTNVEENEIIEQSEEDSSQPSESEAIAPSSIENNDDTSTEVDETSESNETNIDKLPSSKENSISIPNDQGESVSSFENISDNVQLDDNTTEFENAELLPSSAKKRRKRFKTVAEIVVRTDNTKPGEVPNVSIDKINKIVDFKATKSSIRNSRRSNRSVNEANDSVDFNDNLSCIALSIENEASEEELTRLADSIVNTVKRMKLLEKIKRNDSKLTVIITNLPPVKEKEVLVIQRKNIETNISKSDEVQVLISSNKNIESSLHGSIVMANSVGYTILPAATNNNMSSKPNDTILNNSEECENANLNQEHPAIICIQDKANKKGTSEMNSVPGENSESLGTPNDTIIESEENENNSSEAIIHDHPYISPNVKYLLTNPNVSFNFAEVQSKETSSKMKLTENELIFRNKVSKKLRSLKENIQKKNDAISKLKDKVRYLERNLKEVKRNRKNPLKTVKKESALLKNDIFYGVEQLVDTSDFSNTMDYSLNNIELPLGLDENGEESDDDGERECASPITYLCEPAIEVPSKDRETSN